MSAEITGLRPSRKRPECGRPSERATFPFCSTRCKTVDLHRWLSGAYVIAGPETEGGSPGEDDHA